MTTPAVEAVQISTPTCTPGIGSIIRTPQSADLIAGVSVQAYDLWPDDRGYFLEVARLQQGLVADFAPATTQISAALSYPGTIKAFHFHRFQTDVWVPAQGVFQVVLVDFRPDSPTFGRKNTLYTGALKPWQILIPPGVGHGYKVIGEHAGMLVYVTNQLYNPKDEGRIAYNDPSIDYDWELQHK
ncbi:MAG: dTDP-4-dehydrorhamnose 3,5-epimerase family protein [Bryobacteraceae bacterium]